MSFDRWLVFAAMWDAFIEWLCPKTWHFFGRGWNPMVNPRGMRCWYCGAER